MRSETIASISSQTRNNDMPTAATISSATNVLETENDVNDNRTLNHQTHVVSTTSQPTQQTHEPTNLLCSDSNPHFHSPHPVTSQRRKNDNSTANNVLNPHNHVASTTSQPTRDDDNDDDDDDNNNNHNMNSNATLPRPVGHPSNARSRSLAETPIGSQSHTASEPRLRTASISRLAAITASLTAPRQKWNEIKMKSMIPLLRIGGKINVTWKMAGEECTVSSTGSVVSVNGDKAQIAYDDQPGLLPFPPVDKEVEIFGVELKSCHCIPGIPPLTITTGPLTRIRFAIFCDGGADLSTGASASAVLIRDLRDMTETAHGRFFPSTTNNQAEWGAFVAACKFARTSKGTCVIVTDSMNVYDGFVGKKKVGPEFTRFWQEAREIYLEIHSTTTIAHMMRSDSNPADEVAKRVKTSGLDEGMSTAFPICNVIEPKQRKRVAKIPLVSDAAVNQHPAISPVPFQELYRIKCKTRCPPCVAPLFASHVRMMTQKVVNASTPEERDLAMSMLLALPTTLLQVGRSDATNKHDADNLQPGARQENEDVRGNNEDPAIRLASMVQRRANDFNLKSAIRILQSSNAIDIEFEEKMSLLRKKFPTKAELDALRTQLETPSSSSSYSLSTASTSAASAGPPLIGIGSADRLQPTVPFAGSSVIAALKCVSRNAARSIDGWTRDLLLHCIQCNSGIAEDMGLILAMFNDRLFGSDIMLALTSGRLVAIPKADSIRPIVVGPLFTKLLGQCIIKRHHLSVEGQYCYVPNGHEKIVHQCRNAEAQVIVKIDCENAFNVVDREKLAHLVTRQHSDVRQYYATFYGSNSIYYCYDDKGNAHAVTAECGVRQGDSLSTYLFCLMMRKAVTTAPKHPSTEVMLYVDDCTILCDKDHISDVDSIAVSLFRNGMFVNFSKSAISSLHVGESNSISACGFHHTPRNEPFVVLGADLHETPKTIEKQLTKNRKFLDLLRNLPLSEHLKFTILRLCGSPRLIYFCSVNRPAFAKPVVEEWDSVVTGLVKKLFGFQPADGFIHDKLGLGIPSYTSIVDALYNMSVAGSRRSGDKELLITNSIISSSPERGAQERAEYLFAGPVASRLNFTPIQFTVALATRCRSIPTRFESRIVRTCSCGARILNAGDFIDHCFVCNQYSSQTSQVRHDKVRDNLIALTRRYGITTTKEPQCYVYTSGERNRPDILWSTNPPLAIDITITNTKGTVGKEAIRKADEKAEKHGDAVHKMGHIFMPLALEIHGFVENRASVIVKLLQKEIPVHLHKSFYLEFYQTLSISLAQGRSNTIMAALASS